jgi:hypothetical protein
VESNSYNKRGPTSIPSSHNILPAQPIAGEWPISTTVVGNGPSADRLGGECLVLSTAWVSEGMFQASKGKETSQLMYGSRSTTALQAHSPDLTSLLSLLIAHSPAPYEGACRTSKVCPWKIKREGHSCVEGVLAVGGRHSSVTSTFKCKREGSVPTDIANIGGCLEHHIFHRWRQIRYFTTRAA